MAVDRTDSPFSTPRAQRGRGYTLLEILMALTVAGLLTTVALPSYTRFIERQKIMQCEGDLRMIAMWIERYRTQHVDPPLNLTELGQPLPKDPWGRNYRFLNFDSPGVTGQIRKDHNLHPLNTEFDLYSLGKDGRSFPPLTAPASHDDVIWARDGGFIGLASDY